MITFGYLKEQDYFIEKTFIVNNATKYKKTPYSESLIKGSKLIEEKIEIFTSEEIINNYGLNLNEKNYNLLVTNNSFILLNELKDIKTIDLVDQNKIKLLEYYIKIMDERLEINQKFFDLYNIFKEENTELLNKYLKKIKN